MNDIIIIVVDIIIVVISCFISFFIGIKYKSHNKVEFYLVRISKHKYYLYLGKPQIKFDWRKERRICITPNKGKFITDNPYKYGIITSNYDYLEYFTPVKIFLNLED